jgi:hypothetical protein
LGSPCANASGAGGSLYCRSATISAIVPTKGLRPVRASNKSVPTEYQSLAGVSASPMLCSGDMYSGVPTMAVDVCSLGASIRTRPLTASVLAAGRTRPKSKSTTLPSRVTITLDGLMSR